MLIDRIPLLRALSNSWEGAVMSLIVEPMVGERLITIHIQVCRFYFLERIDESGVIKVVYPSRG